MGIRDWFNGVLGKNNNNSGNTNTGGFPVNPTPPPTSNPNPRPPATGKQNQKSRQEKNEEKRRQKAQNPIPFTPIDPNQAGNTNPPQRKKPSRKVVSPQQQNPVQPTQPTQPVQTVQPSQPAQTVQPSQPVQASQPVQPSQPVQTVQPSQPIQLAQPTQPTQPVQKIGQKPISNPKLTSGSGGGNNNGGGGNKGGNGIGNGSGGGNNNGNGGKNNSGGGGNNVGGGGGGNNSGNGGSNNAGSGGNNNNGGGGNNGGGSNGNSNPTNAVKPTAKGILVRRDSSNRGFKLDEEKQPVPSAAGVSGQMGFNNSIRPHLRPDTDFMRDSNNPGGKYSGMGGEVETPQDIVNYMNEQFRRHSDNNIQSRAHWVEGRGGKSGSFIVTRSTGDPDTDRAMNFSPIQINADFEKFDGRTVIMARNKIVTDVYEKNREFASATPNLNEFDRVSASRNFADMVLEAMGNEGFRNSKKTFTEAFSESTGHLMGLPGVRDISDLRNNASLRKVLANSYVIRMGKGLIKNIGEQKAEKDLNYIGSRLSQFGFLQGAVGGTAGVLSGSGMVVDQDTGQLMESEASKNQLIVTHASMFAGEGRAQTAEVGGLNTITASSKDAGKKLKTSSLAERENYLPELPQDRVYEAGGEARFNVTTVFAREGDDVGAGSGVSSIDLARAKVLTEEKTVSQAVPRGFHLHEAVFDSAGLRGSFNQAGGLIMRDGSADADETQNIRFSRMGLQGGEVVRDEQGRAVYDLSLGYDEETFRMIRDLSGVDDLKFLRGYDDDHLRKIFSIDTVINQGRNESDLTIDERSNLEEARKIQGSVAEYLNNRKEYKDSSGKDRILVRSSERLGGGTSGQTDITYGLRLVADAVSNKTSTMKEALRQKTINLLPQRRAETMDERYIAENQAHESMLEEQRKITALTAGDHKKDSNIRMAQMMVYKTEGVGKDRKFVLKDSSKGDEFDAATGLYTNRELVTLRGGNQLQKIARGVKARMDNAASTIEERDLTRLKEDYDRQDQRRLAFLNSSISGVNPDEKRNTILGMMRKIHGGSNSKEYQADVKAMNEAIKNKSKSDLDQIHQKYALRLADTAGVAMQQIQTKINNAKSQQFELQQRGVAAVSGIQNSTYGSWVEEQRRRMEKEVNSEMLSRVLRDEDKNYTGGPVLGSVTAEDAVKNWGVMSLEMLTGALTSKESYFEKARQVVQAEYGTDIQKALHEIWNGDVDKAKKAYQGMIDVLPRMYFAGESPEIQRLEAGKKTQSGIDEDQFRQIYQSGTYAEAKPKTTLGSVLANPDEQRGQLAHQDWYWGKHMKVVQAISNDMYERAQKSGVSVDRRKLDLLLMTHDLTKAMGRDDKDEKVVAQTLTEELTRMGNYSKEDIEWAIRGNRELELLKKEPKRDAAGNILKDSYAGISTEAQIISWADAASHNTNAINDETQASGFYQIFDEVTAPNGDAAQKLSSNRGKIEKDQRKMSALEVLHPQLVQGIDSGTMEIDRDSEGRMTAIGEVADYVNGLDGVQTALSEADRLHELKTQATIDTNPDPTDTTGRIVGVRSSRGFSKEFTGRGRITTETLRAMQTQMPEVFQSIMETQDGVASMWDWLLASDLNNGNNLGNTKDPVALDAQAISVPDASAGQESRFRVIQQKYTEMVNQENSPYKEDSLLELSTNGNNKYVIANPLAYRGHEQSAVGVAMAALLEAYNKPNPSGTEIKKAQEVYEQATREHFAGEGARKPLSSVENKVITWFDRYTASDDVADNEVVIGDRQLNVLLEQANRAAGTKISREDFIKQIESDEGMLVSLGRQPEVSEGLQVARLRYNSKLRNNLTMVGKFFNVFSLGDQDADPVMGVVLGGFSKDKDGNTVYSSFKGAKERWQNMVSGETLALHRLSSMMGEDEWKKGVEQRSVQTHALMRARLDSGYYKDPKQRAEIEAGYDAKTGQMSGKYGEEFRKVLRQGIIGSVQEKYKDASGEEKIYQVEAMKPMTGRRVDASGNQIVAGKEQNIEAERIQDLRDGGTVASLKGRVENLKRETISWAKLGEQSVNVDRMKKGMGIYNLIKSIGAFMNEGYLKEMDQMFAEKGGGTEFMDGIVEDSERSKSSYKFYGSRAQRAKEGLNPEYQRAIDMAAASEKMASFAKDFSGIDLDGWNSKRSDTIRKGVDALVSGGDIQLEAAAMTLGHDKKTAGAILDELRDWNRGGRKGSLGKVYAMAEDAYNSPLQNAMRGAAMINTRAILDDPKRANRLSRDRRASLNKTLTDLENDPSHANFEKAVTTMGGYRGRTNRESSYAAFALGHMNEILKKKGMSETLPGKIIRGLAKAAGANDPHDVNTKVLSPREKADQGVVNSSGADAAGAQGASGTSTNASGSVPNKFNAGPELNDTLLTKFKKMMGMTNPDNGAVNSEENLGRAWTVFPSTLSWMAGDTDDEESPYSLSNGEVGFVNKMLAGAAGVFFGTKSGDPSKSLIGGMDFPFAGFLRSIGRSFEIGNELEEAVFKDPDYVEKYGYRTKINGGKGFAVTMGSDSPGLEGAEFRGEPDLLHYDEKTDTWTIKDIKYAGPTPEKQEKLRVAVEGKDGKTGKYMVQQLAYQKMITAAAGKLIDEKTGDFRDSQDLLDKGKSDEHQLYRTIRDSWFKENEGVDDQKAHELTKSLLKSSLREGGLVLGGILSGTTELGTGELVRDEKGKIKLTEVKGPVDKFNADKNLREKTLVDVFQRARGRRGEIAARIANKGREIFERVFGEWNQSRENAREGLRKAYGTDYSQSMNDETSAKLTTIEKGIAVAMPYMNRENQRAITEEGVASVAKMFDDNGFVKFVADADDKDYARNLVRGVKGENDDAAGTFLALMHTAARGEGSSGAASAAPGSNAEVYNTRTPISKERFEKFATHAIGLTSGKDAEASEQELIRMGVLRAGDLDKKDPNNKNDIGITRDASGKITSSSDEIKAAFMRVVKERYGTKIGDLLGDGRTIINPSSMDARQSDNKSDRSIANDVRSLFGRIFNGLEQSGKQLPAETRAAVTGEGASPLSQPPPNTVNASVQQGQQPGNVGPVQQGAPTITPVNIDYRGESFGNSAPANALGAAKNALEDAKTNLYQIASVVDPSIANKILNASHTQIPELMQQLHGTVYGAADQYNAIPGSASLSQTQAKSAYESAAASMSSPEAKQFFSNINSLGAMPQGVEELEGVVQERQRLQAEAAAAQAAAAPAPGAGAPAGAAVAGGAQFDPSSFATALSQVLGPHFEALNKILQEQQKGSFSDGTNEVKFYGDVGIIKGVLDKIKIDDADLTQSDAGYTQSDIAELSVKNLLGSTERKGFEHVLGVIERLKTGGLGAVTAEDLKGSMEHLRRMAAGIRNLKADHPGLDDKTRQDMIERIMGLHRQIEIHGRANSKEAIAKRKMAAAPSIRQRTRQANAARYRLEKKAPLPVDITTSFEAFKEFTSQSGNVNTDRAYDMVMQAFTEGAEFNDVVLGGKNSNYISDTGQSFSGDTHERRGNNIVEKTSGNVVGKYERTSLNFLEEGMNLSDTTHVDDRGRRFGNENYEVRPDANGANQIFERSTGNAVGVHSQTINDVERRWQRTVAGTHDTIDELEKKKELLVNARKAYRLAFKDKFGSNYEDVYKDLHVDKSGNEYDSATHSVANGKIVETATGKEVGDFEKTDANKYVGQQKTDEMLSYEQHDKWLGTMIGNVGAMLGEGGALRTEARRQSRLRASAQTLAFEANNANYAWGQGDNPTREAYQSQREEENYKEIIGEAGKRKSGQAGGSKKNLFTSMDRLADHFETFMNSPGFREFFQGDAGRILHGVTQELTRFRASVQTLREFFEDPERYGDARAVEAALEQVTASGHELIARADVLEKQPGADSPAVKQLIKDYRDSGGSLLEEANPFGNGTLAGRAVAAGGLNDQQASDLEHRLTGSRSRPGAGQNDQTTMNRLFAVHTVMQVAAGIREAFAGDDQDIQANSKAVERRASILGSMGYSAATSFDAANRYNSQIQTGQYLRGESAARAASSWGGIRNSGLTNMAADVLQPALGSAMALTGGLAALGGSGLIAGGAAALAPFAAPLIVGGAIIAGTAAAVTNYAAAQNDSEGKSRNRAMYDAIARFNGEAVPGRRSAAVGLDPFASALTSAIFTQSGRAVWNQDWWGAAVLNNPETEREAGIRRQYEQISDAATRQSGKFNVTDPTDPLQISRFAKTAAYQGTSYATIAENMGLSAQSVETAASYASVATRGLYNEGENGRMVGTQEATLRFIGAQAHSENIEKLQENIASLSKAYGYADLGVGASRFLGARLDDKNGTGSLDIISDYKIEDIDRLVQNLSKMGAPEDLARAASELGTGTYESQRQKFINLSEAIGHSQTYLTTSQGKAISGEILGNAAMSNQFESMGFKDKNIWKSIIGTPLDTFKDPTGYKWENWSQSSREAVGTAAQAADSIVSNRNAAGLAPMSREEVLKKIPFIYDEEGKIKSINKIGLQNENTNLLTMPILGQQMMQFGILGYGKGSVSQPGIAGEVMMNAMGAQRRDGVYTNPAMESASRMVETFSAISLASSRYGGQGLSPQQQFSIAGSVLDKDRFGNEVSNPYVAANVDLFRKSAESGGINVASVLGIDMNAITGAAKQNSLASSTYMTRVFSMDPQAITHAVLNPSGLDSITASGHGWSDAVKNFGIAPLVSPDTGGQLFGREMSGLRASPDIAAVGGGTHLTGQGAKDAGLIGRSIDPIRQQIFGNSVTGQGFKNQIYSALAGYKYTDNSGKTQYIGGIAGAQLLSNQINYDTQMGQYGIQMQQMVYNRERQLAYDFPSQEMSNEVQRAAALGGIVHTDWMKERGISPMDFSGGTVLTKEMKDAGMTEGVTYEGGRIGQAKFNLKMEKLDLIRGHQQNMTRMGWQQADISRQSYQAGVRADWQREDFGIQAQNMSINRSKQMYDFGFQAREMAISRSQFKEDVSFQNRQRQLQFGWQMEDADINIRRSTGFERKQLVKQKERETVTFNMETEQVNRQNKRQQESFKREEEKFKKEMDHYRKSIEMEDRSFSIQKKRFEQQRKWEEENFSIQKSRADQEAAWAEEAFQRQLARLAVQEDLLKKEEGNEKSQDEQRKDRFKEDKDRAQTIFDLNKKSLELAMGAAAKQKEISDTLVVLNEQEANAITAVNKIAKEVNWKEFGVAMDKLKDLAKTLLGISGSSGTITPNGVDGGLLGSNTVTAPVIGYVNTESFYPKAMGGPVEEGKTYLVGELGAEIITLGKDNRPMILPNSAIPKDRSMSNRGNNEQIHIHVIMDSDEIATYTSDKANTLASRNRKRAFNG